MIFLKRRKTALRTRMSALRKALPSDPDAADALCRNFPDEIWPRIGAVVSGFIPIAGEIDVLKLLGQFACDGAVTALPVTKEGGVLEFRVWRPGDPLVKAGFGLSQPGPDAEPVQPALILAPLLAFDLKGRRLGWGAGFYDREIARLRASGPGVTVAGIGFDAQKVRRVPTGRHDQRLDWIVTERAAYRTRR